MDDNQRKLALIGLRNNAAQLSRTLNACQMCASDNLDSWWEPLTEQPIDGINPAQLCVHAKEGAARAEAARQLLDSAVGLAECVERAVYQLARP